MKKAFTLVELLTVLAIIVLLIGMVMPATFVVRRYAKETKQKAQIMTIDLALKLFKNDYKDYPPSNQYSDTLNVDYCGAQKLSEALLGWDLLGFHPHSKFGGNETDIYNTDTLDERKGRYLESGTANAFRLGNLFANTSFGGKELNPDTFVICDAFGVRRMRIGSRTVKAGTPILYYRANTFQKRFDRDSPSLSIYDSYNNFILISLGALTSDGTLGKNHRLGSDEGLYFYDEAYKVLDPKVTVMTGIPWPYRPDSYILISAGMDGEYGTADDITNF